MVRILLDAMCGGLRGFLRMCGHDAAYALERGSEDDKAVLAIADAEDRTVVTRDEQLAARADDAVLLSEHEPVDQLVELAAAGLDLRLDAEPSRCGRCNGRLERVGGDEPIDDADDVDRDARPDYVPDDIDDLWRCRDCGQYFWKGSHWERVERTLAEVRARAEE